MTGKPDYHERAKQVFGSGLVALAVGGMVVTPGHGENLLSWLDLSEQNGANLELFRSALDLEQRYAAAYTTLLDGPEPKYGSALPVAPSMLAQLVDVDQVLCLVAQTASGDIFSHRAYEGVDLLFVDVMAGYLGEFVSRFPVMHGSQVSRAIN